MHYLATRAERRALARGLKTRFQPELQKPVYRKWENPTTGQINTVAANASIDGVPRQVMRIRVKANMAHGRHARI